MSLYDDLGVRNGASPDEIRDQCRLLMRLLHPDRFSDPALKGAAESQLRRFQEIEEILTDPDRRREHDCVNMVPVGPVRPAVPWNSVAWGVAALACAATIFWVTSPESIALTHPRLEKAQIGTGVPQPISGEDWRATARAAIAERDQALKELSRFRNGFVSPKKENPPVAPVQRPGFAEAIISAASAKRFAGTWSYRSRSGSAKRSYSPEYIETLITEQQGGVHGRYRSRYGGPKSVILPSVNFEFAGKVNGPTGRIPFVREDGVRGEVQLRLLSEHQLELAWTVLSALPNGLTSGTAVLIKTE